MSREPYQHEEVAEFLLGLGWRSSCDAQWTKLRDNMAELHRLARPSREPAVVGNTDAPAGWEPDSSPAEVEEGRALTATLASLAATPAAPGGGFLTAEGEIYPEATVEPEIRHEFTPCDASGNPTPASTPQEDDEYTEQDALQSLMLWLSVGGAHGYVNPRTAEERIRWGVDHIIAGEVNRARRMFHLTNPPEPTPQPAAGVDVVPVSVALSAVEHVGAANYDSRVAEARRWIREAALAPPAPGAE